MLGCADVEVALGGGSDGAPESLGSGVGSVGDGSVGVGSVGVGSVGVGSVGVGSVGVVGAGTAGAVVPGAGAGAPPTPAWNGRDDRGGLVEVDGAALGAGDALGAGVGDSVDADGAVV